MAICDKIGADGGFTNYDENDFQFKLGENLAIIEAVDKYSDARQQNQWTQTKQELIAHAMAHDTLAKDVAILKMVADRHAGCVGKDEKGKPIYQYSDAQCSLLCVGVSNALSLRFKNASPTPDEVGNFSQFDMHRIKSAVGGTSMNTSTKS